MKRVNKNGAYAFLVVILVSSLFMGLTGAIGSRVLSNISATKHRSANSSARFAAKAGLQHTLLMLQKDPSWNGFQDLQSTEFGMLVPGSDSASYTIEIVNNLNGDEPKTALDSTVVPVGTVYCAAMGIQSGRESVRLHAMTGLLDRREPTISHAAFVDSNLNFGPNAETASFDPSTWTYSEDSTGALVDEPSGTAADVGTNRLASLEGTDQIRGSLDKPPSQSAAALADSVTGDVRDLPHPIDTPEFSTPMQNNSQAVPALSPTALSSNNSGPTLMPELDVDPGQQISVGAGDYYFPDGLDVRGTLIADSSVDEDNPVVFYIGNDAKFSANARVNVGGEARSFQMYFVNHNDGTTQELVMDGNSRVRSAIVGEVDAKLSGSSQLFGGFMGRSLVAKDFSRLYYDESLANEALTIPTKWSLGGIVEPRPEVLLKNYPRTLQFVNAVKAGTNQYTKPFNSQQMQTPAS